MSSINPRTRISDEDRSAAISRLGQAFSEGRLSIDEYDSRCQEVAAARYYGDLSPLFEDLPASSQTMAVYSEREVQLAHTRGQRPRAGIMGLTIVGAGTAAILADNAFSLVCLALIAVVYILLYAMKVGPDSWYAPSPRQLERQRRQEFKLTQKRRALERKTQRQQARDEWQDFTLSAAQKFIQKRR